MHCVPITLHYESPNHNMETHSLNQGSQVCICRKFAISLQIMGSSLDGATESASFSRPFQHETHWSELESGFGCIHTPSSQLSGQITGVVLCS